ncbi:MAG TPA: ECF-type sigma factor [Vicinamibacterales bacterium]|nr:ECF-type sigma factor [Vicinamibacterales bacterium]
MGITDDLREWRAGESAALKRLVPEVYSELHRMARRQLRHERPGSLQATVLVSELYMRLLAARRVAWQDRAHFFAMSAMLMRRVLVDAARRRNFQKRGGSARRVTFDEGAVVAPDRGPDLVRLDEALEALAAVAPRKARVVELRYFGGLSNGEIAELLGVSDDTITRDWNFAKTWLQREITRSASP